MKAIMYSTLAAVLALFAVVPTASTSEDSVVLEFERDARGALLGSTIVFVRVKEGYKCKTSQGFLGQKKLATLDKGNPLVSSKNASGVEAAPSDQFRILIRAIAGMQRCDVVASFAAKAGQRYKLTARGDFPFNKDPICSAEVAVAQEGEFKKMEFEEYSQCI